MAHAAQLRGTHGPLAYGRRRRRAQRLAVGDRGRLNAAENPRLGVAGVGLIGGSIALRATSLGIHVVGYDPDPAALQVAVERGMVAACATSFAELAGRSDVLALAGPLEATLEQLAALRSRPTAAFPIFDVASVKAPVARAAAGIGGFVATHPIAGSERSGPLAARADLFEGRVWTVDPAADSRALAATRALLERFGARVIAIPSEEHDRAIALTSHLPQVVSVALGSALAERLNDPAMRDMCGTGMRSMLRLGASSWPVWRAVLEANRVCISQEVRGLASILTDAADALDAGRTGDLEARFTTAAAAVALVNDAATDRKGEL